MLHLAAYSPFWQHMYGMIDCTQAIPRKKAAHTLYGSIWRSKSDSNARTHFCVYLLSREAPSPTWVLLHFLYIRCLIHFVRIRQLWRRMRDSNPRIGSPIFRFSGPAPSASWVILRIWRSVEESNLLRHFCLATGFQPDPFPLWQRCIYGAGRRCRPPWLFSHLQFSKLASEPSDIIRHNWHRIMDSNHILLSQSQACCRYTNPVSLVRKEGFDPSRSMISGF